MKFCFTMQNDVSNSFLSAIIDLRYGGEFMNSKEGIQVNNCLNIVYMKKDDFNKVKNKPKKKGYELIYLITGERKYLVNDTLYKISPGTVVLFDNATNVKTVIYDTAYYEQIVLHFYQSDLDDLNDIIVKYNLLHCFNDGIKMVTLDYQHKEIIENNFTALMNYIPTKSLFDESTAKLTIVQILSLLNTQIQNSTLNEGAMLGAINSKIAEVIMYINKNFHEDLTLNDMAQKFYISPFYLAKKFKQATNATFVQYINALRIKKSKQLLVQSDFKIIDIAYTVGFNSHTHFTRIFTQFCNETPTQFRKEHLGNDHSNAL
ncbi:helix-turn-helix transcriptional regulator [Fusibacter sp. 3D3]|uniref:helix-turn-helix transcriptional regulator n=1 Tax=Fusibacter sp. 3D3 TaxID=1048380 RepID=UPI0015863C59|nr:AraC family transcriptional regulator [Fusibacter sp. 3D3]